MTRLAPDLPPANEEALALSRQLQAQLTKAIKAEGSIGFDRFMEAALYAPGLGYYSAGLSKFGTDGDFITAPELGSLFAECVAARIAPVLARLDDPSMLEIGGGSGAFMHDLLIALERRKALPERYWMLERSATCRDMQATKANALPAHLAERVMWLDEPPTEPFHGVIFANEVLDALPAARFAVNENGAIDEIRVGLDDQGEFCWLHQPAADGLVDAVRGRFQRSAIEPVPGLQGEVCLIQEGWLEAVTASLESGLVLLVDYGYPREALYSPRHGEGTVVCHYRQRVHHEPLWQPGLQDISCFVDFTAVAEAGEAAGLSLAGYTSQAGFLVTACPGWLESQFKNADQQSIWLLAQEFRRLTSPDDMGERFQVMAFTRGISLPTRDWLPDLRNQL